MNSETVSPMPPRRFNRQRNGTSVTPAIGDRTSGGLISICRILNGLTVCGAKSDTVRASTSCGVSFKPFTFSSVTDIACASLFGDYSKSDLPVLVCRVRSNLSVTRDGFNTEDTEAAQSAQRFFSVTSVFSVLKRSAAKLNSHQLTTNSSC